MARICHYIPWLALLLIVLMVTGCSRRSPEEEFPKFPWPPPKASAQYVIPDAFFRKAPNDLPLVRDVEQRIRNALDANGYAERSYYAVPEGFALVTRLEQFDEDGSSKDSPARWACQVQPLRKFSLDEYFKALFTANPGYYRIIVFIVTPVLFDQSDAAVTREEAMAWLRKGLNDLPDNVGVRTYSVSHVCTALIYEFEQPSRGAPAQQKVPGRLSGKEHLVKAKLWERLNK